MLSYIPCLCLFRIVLPVFISVCVLFRPTLLSAIYFLMLLYMPFVPIPTSKSMASHTGVFMKLLMLISCITTCSQAIFQITLLAMPPYAHFLKTCDFLEKLLRHIGFVRLDGISTIAGLTWLSPDPILLVTSVIFFWLFKKLIVNQAFDPINEDLINMESNVSKTTTNDTYLRIGNAIGRYAVLLVLCLAGVLRPSALGGIYFLFFLTSATLWACCIQLNKKFAIFLRCLLPIAFLQMIGLYSYQFQLPQELLDRNSTYARYFGLTTFLTVNCDDPRELRWVANEWASYVCPLAIYWLYYLIVLVSSGLLKSELKNELKSVKQSDSEEQPRYLLSPSDVTESIQLQLLETEEDENKPTLFENILYIFESILQVVIKTSYIATNIMMMAWSITYLSWLTFVLLIWANLIWLVPNQRKSMLRSSPFLVFYAWFLLVSAYVYSLNLTDEELPSQIQGINLAQIGFQKVTYLPCNPLLVKCFYTVMFWISLKQYIYEKIEKTDKCNVPETTVPLEVTTEPSTDVHNNQKKNGKILDKFGLFMNRVLTKFWIWVVAITLFVVAITGDRMTGFRIIYMALFLFFVLSFQISFRFWRRIMFIFWLTVIIYSMIILVMVYTYQFDNFPEYWRDYLHVQEQQQLDIGMERFETKQLFVRLVTPTFFVIITVIQLHYFHKDFMEISNQRNYITSTIVEELDESSMQGGKAFLKDSEKDSSPTPSIKFDFSEIGHITNRQIQHIFEKWVQRLHAIKNIMYIFLEIHMPKIAMFFAMLLCIYDTCSLYLVIIVLISLSCVFGRAFRNFTLYFSSVLVSIVLLARMIYQIEYIDPSNWNVNCKIMNDSTLVNNTKNNAQWFGFVKANQNRSLPSILKWNIIYILVISIWSVVKVRQYNYRLLTGKPLLRAFFMFPQITIIQCNKNLKCCLMYLSNFMFYRFGVELTLIATVTLIGFRMDVYASIYSIWLCIMFSLKRQTLSKIWNFYLIFTAICLPIQYVMVIGLPPTLCIAFPWDSTELLRRLQDWAYLMDNQHPPSPKKLIFDFIVLLFASRQSVAFRIEKRYETLCYTGGNNESIIHQVEEIGFRNKVPDFITYIRSYLDILKQGILLSFMWVTLAIVFLAGTNRVNVFSIGYLIGAFIFLWQGSDIYLRPIPNIIKSWNILLGYNVSVIMLKTFLQLIGCVFIHEVSSSCLTIQLFGVGCVKKFGKPMSIDGIEEPECKVPREFIGLVWDGLCFGFLLVQRRIFQSYDFFHIINETKASAILASRGAELIEELRQKRMTEQEEQERNVLEKIKNKMDRIKASQRKMQESVPKKEVSHSRAIRSGDYYMFDELDDEDIDLQLDKELDEYDLEEKLMQRRPTIGKLLSTALKKQRGLDLQLSSSEYLRRQSSLPVSRELPAVSILSAPLSAPPAISDSRKKAAENLEPQPSTSKQDDESNLSEPRDKDDSLMVKIVQYLLYTWAFLESIMVSLTLFLNRHSKDYRYVMRVLSKEKKELKEKTSYKVGVRLGPGMIWQPAGSYHSLLSHTVKSSSNNDNSDDNFPSEKHDDNNTGSNISSSSHQYSSNAKRNESNSDILEEVEGEEMSSYDQPSIVRLLLAIWHILMSQSELLCYFIVFLNQIKSATFLSLPLPLMVFLWGTLTIPRPSKGFWVTIIAYTEVMVLIKCMFQFDIIPWNNQQGITQDPFYPPRIIGIERKKDYAIWDLLLLLVVFFHRFMLKSMGIWTTNPVAGAIVSDGDYKFVAGKLVPIESSFHDNDNSDLERLVEGPDDKDDNDKTYELTNKLDEQIVSLKCERVQHTQFSRTLQLATMKYTEELRLFFQHLLDPASRIAADVYSFMFLCDFFNFFVILVGYSSFGAQQGDGGVSSYLEDNRVPALFLVMLILQFMLIIIDRGIFLRKNILGKIIFQFSQIFLLHLWLFVLFPIMTGSRFNSVLPPQMYYMVKCFYLLLSAYQIRCGYPTRILGNFLCKGYNYINMFLFKGFMAIPFLFELRTVMDWMWTDTSMTVFDWIKMEDIFAHIFQLKCSRHVEDEYPQPRGERKNPVSKYLMGGAILAVIIAVIWFPLVFFSLGNAVGEANVPYDVTLEIRIGPYEPVYQMSAQSNFIFSFNENEMQKLLRVYNNRKSAVSFISNYEAADIAAIKLSTDSANIWSISPPDRQRMVEEVQSFNPLTVRLEYKVSHKTSKPEDSGVIPDNIEIILPANTPDNPNPVRQNLLQMLQGKTASPIDLQYIMPKFLKVTNRGTAKAISQLMDPEPVLAARSLRNISLTLLQVSGGTNSDKEWWQVHENCSDRNYLGFLHRLPYADCNSIILYTFNDKIFPSTLNIITGGGIIGLYTTIVFVASRVLRGFFAEQCFKIMFEDMPNVDRVLQLCLDVYLVREAREFALEEDLFAKLVFLFRSPETLIKWTRPKEEVANEEDPED